MFEPTCTPSWLRANVYMRGRQRHPGKAFDDIADLSTFCRTLGSDLEHTCVLLPPSSPGVPGFQKVVQGKKGRVLFVDGVVWDDPKTAVTIVVRDCLTIFLRYQRFWAALHAGRDSLFYQNGGCISCVSSVIQNALDAMGVDDSSSVFAYMLGGICAKHFSHEHPGAEARIAHYDQLRDPHMFLDRTRGELDLYRAAQVILERQGVPTRNISKLEVCTYTNPLLSSKRAFDAGNKNKQDYNFVGIQPYN